MKHTPTTPKGAELLTYPQLAAKLSVSKRTLTTWVGSKIIPVIKVGRTCRFDLAKVKAALEKHEQPATSRP